MRWNVLKPQQCGVGLKGGKFTNKKVPMPPINEYDGMDLPNVPWY